MIDNKRSSNIRSLIADPEFTGRSARGWLNFPSFAGAFPEGIGNAWLKNCRVFSTRYSLDHLIIKGYASRTTNTGGGDRREGIISGISLVSTGLYEISFSNTFSTNEYCALVNPNPNNPSGAYRYANICKKSTTFLRFCWWSGSGTLENGDWSLVVFDDRSL